MKLIEVEDNPNCKGYPQMAYADLEPAKEVVKVRIEKMGKMEECWITGVDEGGSFTCAQAQKVTDSGAGAAYLVFGGDWGVRLQKEDPAKSPWDLNSKEQWGEHYLVLDSENDLIFS